MQFSIQLIVLIYFTLPRFFWKSVELKNFSQVFKIFEIQKLIDEIWSRFIYYKLRAKICIRRSKTESCISVIPSFHKDIKSNHIKLSHSMWRKKFTVDINFTIEAKFKPITQNTINYTKKRHPNTSHLHKIFLLVYFTHIREILLKVLNKGVKKLFVELQVI